MTKEMSPDSCARKVWGKTDLAQAPPSDVITNLEFNTTYQVLERAN